MTPLLRLRRPFHVRGEADRELRADLPEFESARQSAGEVKHSVEIVRAKLPGTGNEFLHTRRTGGIRTSRLQRVNTGQRSSPGGPQAPTAHRTCVPYKTALQ